MDARHWEEKESRLEIIEQRIENDRRFHEPSDEAIRVELERRAKERGISVEQLIDRTNQKEQRHE